MSDAYINQDLDRDEIETLYKLINQKSKSANQAYAVAAGVILLVVIWLIVSGRDEDNEIDQQTSSVAEFEARQLELLKLQQEEMVAQNSFLREQLVEEQNLLIQERESFEEQIGEKDFEVSKLETELLAVSRELQNLEQELTISSIEGEGSENYVEQIEKLNQYISEKDKELENYLEQITNMQRSIEDQLGPRGTQVETIEKMLSDLAILLNDNQAANDLDEASSEALDSNSQEEQILIAPTGEQLALIDQLPYINFLASFIDINFGDHPSVGLDGYHINFAQLDSAVEDFNEIQLGEIEALSLAAILEQLWNLRDLIYSVQDLQPIYNNNPSLNQENIDIEELLEILERLADDYLNSQRNVAKLAIFSQLNREPITDAAPEYPRRAARQDVEGEVTLTYSINLLGEIVDNSINVTAANPEGYFEEVSIEALEKRSFEPLEVPAFIQSYGNVININQLQLSNLQQTFRFDLE